MESSVLAAVGLGSVASFRTPAWNGSTKAGLAAAHDTSPAIASRQQHVLIMALLIRFERWVRVRIIGARISPDRPADNYFFAELIFLRCSINSLSVMISPDWFVQVKSSEAAAMKRRQTMCMAACFRR